MLHSPEILNELDEIIYISDIETYELLFVNTVGSNMLSRLGIKDILGKKCYQVLQGRESPCEFCTNKKLAPEKFYVWEHQNLRNKRYYLSKDKLIEWNGKLARMEISIDITGKENEKKQIQDKLKIEETLVECIRTLLDEKSLSLAIEMIMQTIGSFYEADRAYLFQFDYEADRAWNTYEWCGEGVSPQIDALQDIPLSEMMRWTEAFLLKGVIQIDALKQNVAPGTFEYDLLDAQGIDSLIAVPVMEEDKIMGCLGVDNPRAAKEDFSLLRSLSYFVKTNIERQKTNEQLQFLSYTDGLTGLGNRNKYISFLDCLEKEHLSSLGIVFVDLNGLKSANDTMGHCYGDQLIIRGARVLKACFCEDIFRIGGDEFIAFCKNASRKAFSFRVEQMKQACQNEKGLSISFGATWQDRNLNIPKMIKYADELMYIDKQDYYKSAEGKKSPHHSVLLEETLQAIENKRYLIYLQPKIHIETGKMHGAEALLRKLDKNAGALLLPEKFIPILEEEHLVRHVDFYVLEEVCKLLAQWRRKQMPMFPISVNFSRITLMEQDIVEKMKRICDLCEIPSRLIDIEVTESIGQMNLDSLAAISQELRKQGFTLSLDDFGSKYSNLSLLTVLKFNALKLDQSLIEDLERNRNARIIAKHAIEICKDMEETVSIAEGVQTARQLEILKDMHCDYVQGFYYSKPLGIDEFTKQYLL